MNIIADLENQITIERALLDGAVPAIRAAESVEAYLQAAKINAIARGRLNSEGCSAVVMVQARYIELTNALEHAGVTPELTHESGLPWSPMRYYTVNHQGHTVTLCCMPPLPQIASNGLHLVASEEC